MQLSDPDNQHINKLCEIAVKTKDTNLREILTQLHEFSSRENINPSEFKNFAKASIVMLEREI
jgi:hypothetical protein